MEENVSNSFAFTVFNSCLTPLLRVFDRLTTNFQTASHQPGSDGGQQRDSAL